MADLTRHSHKQWAILRVSADGTLSPICLAWGLDGADDPRRDRIGQARHFRTRKDAEAAARRLRKYWRFLKKKHPHMLAAGDRVAVAEVRTSAQYWVKQ